MGWKQWSAVVVVIGGGILLQLWGHDGMDMDRTASQHAEMPASMAEPQGPYRTVAFEVTGMT